MTHDEEPQGKPKNKEKQDRINSAFRMAEQQVKVDDTELKTIKIRLDGIKDAAQRSRSVFIIMTIVASAIIITLWNGMLSWDREKAFGERIGLGVYPSSRVVQNQDELVSEWIKSQTISVGLLGIRVGVSDLTVIGSACLIIVMMWYFFSQRRENRAIVSLLQDCTEGFKKWRLNKDVCSMVYQGIIHSLVFIDVEKGDEPLSSLKVEDKEDDNKSAFLLRPALKFLVYLPPVTIICIMLIDLFSLLFSSPFRTSTEPLWRIVFYESGYFEKIEVIGFEVFAFFAFLYTLYLCHLSRQFSKATTETLRDFEAVIEDSEEFLKDPDKFLEERKEKLLKKMEEERKGNLLNRVIRKIRQ